jgi:hypothetical protein
MAAAGATVVGVARQKMNGHGQRLLDRLRHQPEQPLTRRGAAPWPVSVDQAAFSRRG